MPNKRKIIKRVILSLLVVLLLVVLSVPATVLVLSSRADMKAPAAVADTSLLRTVYHDGYTECAGSMLRQSESGLWEAYVSGAAPERGAAIGKLTEELLHYQEEVFVGQIRVIVPSDGYLKFLRRMLLMFNRNLGENVPEEFREEIYGISQSCSHEFDAIGTPYERQLNYHAAHDIGHTMQDYMLVGCSSLGAWGALSADSSLIIGRNFDFWVGDDFARNKLVSFYAPEKGYKFASVGWPGMTGVLSGMNEKGLTVTINAAKGPLPTSSATPISVLAREILQYASNIEEAWEIAGRRRTFVSESILIGSAADGKAVVIEKSPEDMALFDSGDQLVVCTNHYQSDFFADDEHNVENIRTSDSRYRYDRVRELACGKAPLDAAGMASILRDRYGVGGRDIGLTNEKAPNQSIAHHAVIFKPEEGLMWVSTEPWQSGRFVCYDLNQIFAAPDFSGEIYAEALNIPADSLFMTNDYPRVVAHREMTAAIKEAMSSGKPLEKGYMDAYIANNPELYYVYRLSADYCISHGDKAGAAGYLRTGLTKEIPRLAEKEQMEKQLKKIER